MMTADQDSLNSGGSSMGGIHQPLEMPTNAAY
jgi:hypothetical protein